MNMVNLYTIMSMASNKESLLSIFSCVVLGPDIFCQPATLLARLLIPENARPKTEMEEWAAHKFRQRVREGTKVGSPIPSHRLARSANGWSLPGPVWSDMDGQGTGDTDDRTTELKWRDIQFKPFHTYSIPT